MHQVQSSSDSVVTEKIALRRHLLRRRDTFFGRTAASAAICEHLAGLVQVRTALTVHSYLPMGSEVDPQPLLAQLLQAGVRLAAPVLLPDRRMVHSWITTLDPAAWQDAPFRTRAPRDLQLLSAEEIEHLAVTLVPLVGFDATLARIGYGGGYYDRFLPSTTAVRIGLAFACQSVDVIPREDHDVSLDVIVTEATLFARVKTVP